MSRELQWSETLYFLIDGKYYDLTNFIDKHPGGENFLRFSKRYSIDQTTHFNMHHVNYNTACTVLSNYRIRDPKSIEHCKNLIEKEKKVNPYYKKQVVSNLEKGRKDKEEYLKVHKCLFQLPQQDSFYCDLRNETRKYFAKLNNKRKMGPKQFALNFWWFLICLYLFSLLYNMMYNVYLRNKHGSMSYFEILLTSCVSGIIQGWLIGYGHQWVHMPLYRKYGYILDWSGLYSHGFHKEHILLHHTFTNSYSDNLLDFAEPFIIVNPIKERSKHIHKYIVILIGNITFFVGFFINHIYYGIQWLLGNEEIYWYYFLLYMKLYGYCTITYILTGWRNYNIGILMFFIENGVTSYYFLIVALMNHNQEILTWDLNKISKCKDWGEYQLAVSCDIGFNYNWLQSMLCLFQNYHTIHHLFPATDLSHHGDIQNILIRVSEKHHLKYNHRPVWDCVRGLFQTMTVATALNQVKRIG